MFAAPSDLPAMAAGSDKPPSATRVALDVGARPRLEALAQGAQGARPDLPAVPAGQASVDDGTQPGLEDPGRPGNHRSPSPLMRIENPRQSIVMADTTLALSIACAASCGRLGRRHRQAQEEVVLSVQEPQ